MTIEWLLQIEKQEEFEDEAAGWREKTTNNGFSNFLTFFSDRDKAVRRLAKLRLELAKNAGYLSSAANVNKLASVGAFKTENENLLTTKLEDGFATVALALEKSLHQAIGAPGSTKKNPIVPTSVPAPTKSSKVLITLRNLQDCMSTIKSNNGGGDGGGNNNTGSSEHTKCCHYNRYHPHTPEAQC